MPIRQGLVQSIEALKRFWGLASKSSKRAVLTNPYLGCKVLSLENGRGYSIVSTKNGVSPTLATDGLPIPPTKKLRLGYGASAEDYIVGGERDVQKLLETLRAAGTSVKSLERVLEVGCSAGRMLRHIPRLTGASQSWGVDISAEHIRWAQQHLSPPLLLATTTTAPHLPFEDNYFDLVYCGSVFTHISDLADAWFLEIRRVLRVGGHAFITIHDERIITWLIEGKPGPWMAPLARLVRATDRRSRVLSQPYQCFWIEADEWNQTHVFYDSSALVKKWSSWATFISLTPEAYSRQTALLFRK